MKLMCNVNRSGKATGSLTPAQPGFIPADMSADDLGMTAILISSNGDLVSADPVPEGIEGAFRFGDPALSPYVVYAFLCPVVAIQQIGSDGSEPEFGEVFRGAVRCGKAVYIGVVSALSESFLVQDKKKITIDFKLDADMSAGMATFMPRSVDIIHANCDYLDVGDLAKSDFVIYPEMDVVDPSDPSVVRAWSCGISEAPSSVTSSSVSCDDGAGNTGSWFATIFPSGFVQPDPLTENIIGTSTGIYPDAEGSAKYNLTAPMTRPIAIAFPSKVFFWLCVGYSMESHRAGSYLVKIGNPVQVLAVVQGACGMMIGPTIVG